MKDSYGIKKLWGCRKRVWGWRKNLSNCKCSFHY